MGARSVIGSAAAVQPTVDHSDRLMARRDDHGTMLFARGIRRAAKRVVAEEGSDARVQRGFYEAAEMSPYPCAVDGIPLFDAYGALNEVYVDDLPEPVDVTPVSAPVTGGANTGDAGCVARKADAPVEV